MKNRIFEALRWVKFAMIILAIGISIISCELCIPKGNLCITIEKSSDMAAKTLLQPDICLLYTSDAADDLLCVDLDCRRIIKKKIHFISVN